jgi:hypothetical protein
VHHAAAGAVVVPAEEVLVCVADHVGGGHRDVVVPIQSRAGAARYVGGVWLSWTRC